MRPRPGNVDEEEVEGRGGRKPCEGVEDEGPPTRMSPAPIAEKDVDAIACSEEPARPDEEDDESLPVLGGVGGLAVAEAFDARRFRPPFAVGPSSLSRRCSRPWRWSVSLRRERERKRERVSRTRTSGIDD